MLSATTIESRPADLLTAFSKANVVAIGRIVVVHPYAFTDGWSLAQFEAKECWKGCSDGDVFYYAQVRRSTPESLDLVLMFLQKSGRPIGDLLNQHSVKPLQGVVSFQLELLKYPLKCRSWLSVEDEGVFFDTKCIEPGTQLEEYTAIDQRSPGGELVIPKDLLFDYLTDPMARQGLFRASEQELRDFLESARDQLTDCEVKQHDECVSILRSRIGEVSAELERIQNVRVRTTNVESHSKQ